MEMKFFRCKHCGQIVGIVKNTNVPIICCGEKMIELIPNTSDGAFDKHIPVVEVDGNKVTVKVGSNKHPMVEEHYIEWIAIQTESLNQRKKLNPGEEPIAEFYIDPKDKVLKVYAYCNIHGLYELEIK